MELAQDRLELIGVPVGIFIVLVGLGTLAGQPWQYAAGGVPVMLLQILGAVGAIAVGVSLVYLTHVVEA